MEMINDFLGFNSNCNEKILKLVEIIKKVADATYTVMLALQKSKRALIAIESNDKSVMCAVLQEYLRQYALFINSITFLTNIRIIKVSSDYYDSITGEGISEQLKMVIRFVYLKEFTDSNAKSALKNKVKSMLPNSGIFTQKELRYIF